MSNYTFVGIFFCPICKKTRRFYSYLNEKIPRRTRRLCACEECRMVKLVCDKEPEFNIIGVNP